jgi:hypothetical protein
LDAAAVMRMLRGAGYPLVRSEVPVVPGKRDFVLDVVAWGPDSQGELIPQVAVEVKQRDDQSTLAAALRQLELARDVLGTRRNYVVLGDSWYAGDGGLVTATPVAGPSPVISNGPIKLTNPELVADLLIRRMFRLAGTERGRLEAGQLFISTAAQVIRETLPVGGIAADGLVIHVPREVLADALFGGLLTQLARPGSAGGQYLTLPPVASVLGRLLQARGGLILDPFCGSASLLWHAARHRISDVPMQLVGRDIDERVIMLASIAAELLPDSRQITLGDSLHEELPQAEYVISQPPIGLRVNHNLALLDGSTTSDADLIVLDRCISALRVGGRAALHTGRGWMSRESAMGYREWLNDNVRVAALIGLPGGLFTDSRIDSVVVVIERKPPTPTFVAQLGADWPIQLGENGPALNAYREHLRELG